MKTLRAGGLCSGIGGFSTGFEQAGIESVWEVEIDAKCRTVLKRRFPNTLVLDDMLAFEPTEMDAVDILAGGTPCQGFSVAGLRKSLSDERSNLALRFIYIADRLNPAVIVWENVPGVLSTKDNALGCFLAGLVGADTPLVPTEECGGRWTNAGVVDGPKRAAAWRILDSQFFGVAQRRERVIVVASARKELPFQILFEPESVRRYSPPRREKGEGVAPTISARTKGGGGLGTDFDCDGGLISEIAFALQGAGKTSQGSQGSNIKHDCMFTLNRIDVHGIAAISYRTAGNCGPFEQGDKTGALNTATDPNQNIVLLKPEDSPRWSVRRLTPVECLRLQGFSDDHCEDQSDSATYKQTGNAVTVNVARWIGKRIVAALT